MRLILEHELMFLPRYSREKSSSKELPTDKKRQIFRIFHFSGDEHLCLLLLKKWPRSEWKNQINSDLIDTNDLKIFWRCLEWLSFCGVPDLRAGGGHWARQWGDRGWPGTEQDIGLWPQPVPTFVHFYMFYALHCTGRTRMIIPAWRSFQLL